MKQIFDSSDGGEGKFYAQLLDKMQQNENNSSFQYNKNKGWTKLLKPTRIKSVFQYV
ncbi:hypothetical protein KSF_054340 [Reticulibacter mediterranei]|uniref:Uncharacterized protein n=1 Tax=Reticulibacter mediterranei TaxID=2778369 RepID=A0A8J3ISF0_9CHLR|nr:hypothetical protein KSF_054340 [Reticulibacter mediterranei]